MPNVFDNIDLVFLPALKQTLGLSDRADFCIGYFNLRGWKQLDSCIETWSGSPDRCARLLVGMQRPPQEELRLAMSLVDQDERLDNQTVIQLKKKLAAEFREQLTIGAPTNEDEAGLRRLARQIRKRQVVVKLFLRHSLHAKLYLLFRPDPINPIVGYLGSSNLTFAGLVKQGELNIDVLDGDACKKLAKWFEDRWTDRWCVDISDELAATIDESWAREELIPPHHIYVKIAYHLSQEARAGLSEFRIPRDFGNKLLDFQTAAVKIAAHHLNKRGGVLIGDVVGLGKTLMATALARIFEDDQGLETLIICPKNLVPMWEDYRDQFRLRARILSISRVARELPDLRRYRLLLLDESQNLRNREGKRYRIIQDYVRANDSKCILLSATPYNKTYLDLSSQLRLFVPEDADLGVRPERLLREIGETEFIRRHQASVRSLAAFEKSTFADDWRELMRLYLVRRTRSFIQQNYAHTDAANGRKYLVFEDGSRSYFPARSPQTVRFKIDDADPNDQYARLYSGNVVSVINALTLPRYGLGNYVAPTPKAPPTSAESKILDDLSRAGNRLRGFCRTNLFKRLESSGHTFLLSVERHILRNYVFLYAIDNELPLPIGTFDAAMLDAQSSDVDAEAAAGDLFDDDDQDSNGDELPALPPFSEADLRDRAAEIYQLFADRFKRRFRWLSPLHFIKQLTRDLQADSKALADLLKSFGHWNSREDQKLAALTDLVSKRHPQEKILVFSQFADTVDYLAAELKNRGVSRISGVTGDSPDATGLAWRFSPRSNKKDVKPHDELRVLLATDVLSEGQNLQDCAIVVNYDLPWAIIRLIQRAGRVDRIGQQAETIICYSFLPADGIERVIRLRARVRARLRENAEVVGTDEAFFEDDAQQVVLDLYNEKAGILDGDEDTEVDLSSYAYQIWKNATSADPKLRKIIEDMPPVVYSSKSHPPDPEKPEGVLVYVRTHQGNDALAWVNRNGVSVTESQFEILKASECAPDTPAVPRHETHHDLVRVGAQLISRQEKEVGGQLGRPSGARFRTYDRLKRYAEAIKGTLFDTEPLRKAIDDIYKYPLRQSAIDTLNRQLKGGVSDQGLAELVIALREEDQLSIIHEGAEQEEPLIICSMGLIPPEGAA